MSVFYEGDTVTLHHGDCIEVMQTLPANSVDAICTDPPYGLGFMGKAWDDLPPSLPWALECLRVLKPGGYLLAFGGTRTWHRLAVAVEDAGFEVRDSIAWLYGSGFPKSLNIAKAIDKRKIGSDEVDAFKRALGSAVFASGKSRKQINDECGFTMRFDITFDRDPEGWGCSLPTADQYDVICRVLGVEDDGQVSALRAWPRTNMERLYRVVGHQDRTNSPSGIVGLGRESVRVARELTEPGTDAARQWSGWGTALKPAFEPIVVARKPMAGTVAANVLAWGTGGLNIDGTRVEAGKDYADKCASVVGLSSGHGYSDLGGMPRSDSAHAAGRWPTNVLLDGDQADQLDAMGPHTRDGVAVNRNRTERNPSTVGFTSKTVEPVDVGFGGAGGPSRFFPTFRYQAKAPAAERPKVDGIAHPTVKPLALMRWLVRLVTPPGGLVLEPFAGSGATVEACLLEGFQCIAIEREADYLPLTVARLQRHAHTDEGLPVVTDQLDLFGESA